MSFQQNKFKEIADCIRSLSGWTQKIKPSMFATEISSIHEAALMRGHENGLEDARHNFWDAFQENGNRKTYNYSFCGWTDEYYNPKYPISLEGANSVGNTYNSSKITDTKVPIIASCQTLVTLFSNSTQLVTIPHLDVSGVTNLIDRCFNSCTRLENLTMVGSINANGFDVSPCKKLTKTSLISILTALADKTQDPTGTDWVCTLGTDNLNKLTNAEIAIATEKGWSLA